MPHTYKFRGGKVRQVDTLATGNEGKRKVKRAHESVGADDRAQAGLPGESGMNKRPLTGFSLASRLVCSQCGTTPEIVDVNGNDPMFIKVRCHGVEETKSIDKKNLVFTQECFAPQGTEAPHVGNFKFVKRVKK